MHLHYLKFSIFHAFALLLCPIIAVIADRDPFQKRTDCISSLLPDVWCYVWICVWRKKIRQNRTVNPPPPTPETPCSLEEPGLFSFLAGERGRACTMDDKRSTGELFKLQTTHGSVAVKSESEHICVDSGDDDEVVSGTLAFNFSRKACVREDEEKGKKKTRGRFVWQGAITPRWHSYTRRVNPN